jgi:hypothetical protein
VNNIIVTLWLSTNSFWPKNYVIFYLKTDDTTLKLFVLWHVTGTFFKSQDNIVSRVTGYGLDDRGVGVQVPVKSKIFSSTHRPDRLWGPPNLLSNEYWGIFPREVKRSGREADHSPPTSAEVKKMWTYTSTPPYAFMASCLIS